MGVIKVIDSIFKYLIIAELIACAVLFGMYAVRRYCGKQVDRICSMLTQELIHLGITLSGLIVYAVIRLIVTSML